MAQKNKKKEYSNESIRALKGPDRVRRRPGVIFGSDDLSGCIHGVFEIISNSRDEAKKGFGKDIYVTRYCDGSIEVRDNGRGVPLDWNKAEERWNWDLVYCELYAGGNYDNGDDESGVLGLNGLGACATQYASEWFDVESTRDGYTYKVHFEKGNIVGEMTKTPAKDKTTGTIQRWKPDLEVFTDVDIPVETFQVMLKEQAIVNAGISYHFIDEESKINEVYTYPDGILGYVRELDNDEGITTPVLLHGDGRGRDRDDKPEYEVSIDVAFCFSNKQNLLKYYHNSSWLEHGGSPDKAVRSALVSAIDTELKKRGKYNKGEKKVTFDDIQDSLILIVNSASSRTSYENQTKKSIKNKFYQSFMTDMLKEQLEVWFIENKADGDRAIDQILVNKRSRERSEETRIQVKKKLQGKIDVTNKVKNLVECREKDPKKREVFIVEGQSALGSVKLGRNAENQAIICVRGKVLNLEKASLAQIFASDIIMDLMRVVGCGIELRDKKAPKDIPAFDIDKLNYDKVIIMTDQDVDGFHIVCLLITLFYKLCPMLIETGHVYVAETPLHEITYTAGNKKQTFYAFSDGERDKILKGKDPKRVRIQRSKGLGENDTETMSLFMSPGTRHLTQVQAKDAKEMAETIELFMGGDVAPRYKYIEENGHLYMDDLDVF